MMMKIASCTLFLCLSLTKCEPPSNSYGPPPSAPISSYGTPNYNVNGGDHHNYGEPKAYEFGYQVKDDYTGNNYDRQEASDGNQVRGEYRVALPDGRTQIVSYYADWQTGFHADVRYEGTAQYPEQDAAYNSNYDYNQESATSSVNIKDYSSDASPYNTHYNYNNYDSYNGNFQKQNTEYGAP